MTIPDFPLRLARKVIYPLLPGKARLPFIYALHSMAGTIEPELRNLGKISGDKGVAVDVGANIGLFSYRMASLFSKVYAFEINEDVATDLIAYNSSRIEIAHCGLSSDERDLTLYIPVSRGVALNGWASLLPGNCPDTHEHIEKRVRVRPLDSFSLSGVSFIKIDVEGHEFEVLRGAAKTIASSRPVVLVEVKEENVARVAAFFAAIHYKEVSLQQLCGVTGARENRIYRPDPRANGA